ncbi:DUF1353 domain-containing protein [Nitrobacter sp.]|uniref:DUF1353 domain-containing protein n=1 Tax=Nitrobacter sp. TaxID=29420 RepID=UPI00399D7173
MAQRRRRSSFGDEKCTLWSVPAGATVDGASIPQLFWSLLGGRNASAIHDWFCTRRTMASEGTTAYSTKP